MKDSGNRPGQFDRHARRKAVQEFGEGSLAWRNCSERNELVEVGAVAQASQVNAKLAIGDVRGEGLVDQVDVAHKRPAF